MIAQASVCECREGLARALTHIRLASASLTAVSSVGQASVVVAKQIPSNERINKQLRFVSTQAKQQEQILFLTKPSASDIREVNRKLLESGEAGKSSTKEPQATDLSEFILT